MTRRNLLLDYHGVISDGERLPSEWRRLLGEFLTPRYGGSPTVWADANRYALERSLARAQAFQAGSAAAAPAHEGVVRYEEFRRTDRVEWLRDMLLFAQVSVPSEAELDVVALEATRYVPPRARATVPAAADALKALHGRGFALFTASGDDAENLDGYLRGLGVRELFQQTYGADLLGISKTGPAFYAALLAHAALNPARTIVVDDDAWRLDWARALGMNTVLVRQRDRGAPHPRVAQLAELPDLLE